jgi:hypothetical protein
MKKILIFISSLSLFLLNYPLLQAVENNKVSITQNLNDISIKWSYPKNFKPKYQTMILEELAEDSEGNYYSIGETSYKLTTSQRSKSIKDLKISINYKLSINTGISKNNLVKEFKLSNKPSMPHSLSYNWNNTKPDDKLSLSWKYQGEKVDNWILSIYKANIKVSEESDTQSLEEINSSEEDNEIETILKKVILKGSLRKYDISGLSKSEGYRILIEGKNKAGLGEFNNFTITQSSPNEPINLKVEKAGTGSDNNLALLITWEYAGPEVTSFSIGVRAAGFNEDLKVYKISPNVRSFTINNLSKNGYYQFVIKAINDYSYTTAITEPFLVKIPIAKPKDPLQEKLEEEAGGEIQTPGSSETIDNQSPDSINQTQTTPTQGSSQTPPVANNP